MDDNIKKSKIPIFVSFTNFLKMLGPTLGFTMASYCLRIYVAPDLHPTIDNRDPRWIGAYWLGWFILGACLMISGIMISCFPKVLPRAAIRLQESKEKKPQTTASIKGKFKWLCLLSSGGEFIAFLSISPQIWRLHWREFWATKCIASIYQPVYSIYSDICLTGIIRRNIWRSNSDSRQQRPGKHNFI